GGGEMGGDGVGEGGGYGEILELTADRPQRDGSRLTIASLIRPGWVLRMPHDAYGPGIEEVTASPPARHSGPPHERPPSAQRPPARHAAQPPAAPAPPASHPATQAPAPPSPGASASAPAPPLPGASASA